MSKQLFFEKRDACRLAGVSFASQMSAANNADTDDGTSFEILAAAIIVRCYPIQNSTSKRWIFISRLATRTSTPTCLRSIVAVVWRMAPKCTAISTEDWASLPPAEPTCTRTSEPTRPLLSAAATDWFIISTPWVSASEKKIVVYQLFCVFLHFQCLI